MIPLKISLGFHGFALHHIHNLTPEPMRFACQRRQEAWGTSLRGFEGLYATPRLFTSQVSEQSLPQARHTRRS